MKIQSSAWQDTANRAAGMLPASVSVTVWRTAPPLLRRALGEAVTNMAPFISFQMILVIE